MQAYITYAVRAADLEKPSCIGEVYDAVSDPDQLSDQQVLVNIIKVERDPNHDAGTLLTLDRDPESFSIMVPYRTMNILMNASKEGRTLEFPLELNSKGQTDLRETMMYKHPDAIVSTYFKKSTPTHEPA